MNIGSWVPVSGRKQTIRKGEGEVWTKYGSESSNVLHSAGARRISSGNEPSHILFCSALIDVDFAEGVVISEEGCGLKLVTGDMGLVNHAEKDMRRTRQTGAQCP